MQHAVAVVRAFRPNFLILAPLCAAGGIAVAWRQGVPLSVLDLGLVLLGALLAHAAVNLFNEYDDFRSGLDLLTRRTPFSGGSGALPETPEAAGGVRAAALGTLALVVAIGLYFLWHAGWPILVIGIAGLALILTYTRWLTRHPLLCLLAPGLGFGPVMVLGSVLALGGRIDAMALLVALVALLLVSELLLINQIPDAEADRQVGRRHLVILAGRDRAARVVALLLLGGYLVVIAGVAAGVLPGTTLLALLPLPAALWLAARLPGAWRVPERLHRVLGTNVAVLLSTLALLALGLSL